MSALVLQETRDGVCSLTLNRPTARNSINGAMLAELRDIVEVLRDDRSVRVVVLRGAGDQCFCAGYDMDERADMGVDELRAFVNRMRFTFNQLATLPKAVVASINGLALGPGWELALCADFRIAAQNATLVFNEVRHAMIPAAGGTQRLARLVGSAKAKELIMAARRVRAPEAHRIGLVNEVIQDEELDGRVATWVQDLLQAGPIALEQAKFVIDQGAHVDMATGTAIESKALEVLLPTKDRLEALAAFMDKRKARFEGR